MNPSPPISGRLDSRLEERRRKSGRWRIIFLVCTIVSVFFLAALLAGIVNQAFGYVLVQTEEDPAKLVPEGETLSEQDAQGLSSILQERLSRRLYRKLDTEAPLAERSRAELLGIIDAEILKPHVIATWSLFESIFFKPEIMESVVRDYQGGSLQFRSWVSASLLFSSQSSDPLRSGIRGALLGSLLTILFTILFALPLGVAAAVWLEEYARDNWVNRVIRTNIYNLAGVPSIIYGMLGLALFVRAMAPLTSGAIFGVQSEGTSLDGRTVLSASLSLALLILPIIIINAQEAMRAVPQSLRQSSLALGATRWQTVWHHVLPASADRILTGAVLAISRALGETAPLVVVGASTFLSMDPTGPFSKFTTLPIQIYQWSARPQQEFRNLAAGAIVVLLVMLLSLNASVIYMRAKYSNKKAASQ
jgi:phosphate transport system permease protein